MFGRRKRKCERAMRVIAIAEAAEKKVQLLPKTRKLEMYALGYDGKWADDFGPKPDDWDALRDDEQAFILNCIATRISCGISRKEKEKYMHMTVQGETQEEFNDWWESQFPEMLRRIAGRLR